MLKNLTLRNDVLEITDGINNSGELIWQLALALFVSWFLVYLMVVNGIKVNKFIELIMESINLYSF